MANYKYFTSYTFYSNGRFFYSNDCFLSDQRETFFQEFFSTQLSNVNQNPDMMFHEILIGLIQDPYFMAYEIIPLYNWVAFHPPKKQQTRSSICHSLAQFLTWMSEEVRIKG